MDRPRVAVLVAEADDDGAVRDLDLDAMDPMQRDIAIFGHVAKAASAEFNDLLGSIALLAGMPGIDALKQRVRERGTAELHRMMADIAVRRLGSDAERATLMEIFMNCEAMYNSRNTMKGIKAAYARFLAAGVHVTRETAHILTPYHDGRDLSQFVRHLRDLNVILPMLCIGAIDECALMSQLGVPREHLAVNGSSIDDIVDEMQNGRRSSYFADKFHSLTQWMVAVSRGRSSEDLALPAMVDIAIGAADTFIEFIFSMTRGPLAIDRAFVLMFMLGSMREFIGSLVLNDDEKGAIMKPMNDIDKLLLVANNDVLPTSFVTLTLL